MRRHFWILSLLAAALGGVGALGVTHEPTLGLDLQGGLEVILQAEAPKGRQITDEDIKRSIEIMRERVDKIGVTEPEIRQQGASQIAISLPGVHDSARAAELVGKTAQLEFYMLQRDLVPPSITVNGEPVPESSLFALLAKQQARAESGTPTAWYLFSKGRKLLAGPAPTKDVILGRFRGGEAPAGSRFLAVPEGRIVLSCGQTSDFCPGLQVQALNRSVYYLFRYQPESAESPIPEMTGSDLDIDGTRQDFDPQTGEAIVLMQFTSKGAKRFHEITRQLAVDGRLRAAQIGNEDAALQSFAIVLDGEIRSFPTIDFRRYPDGIEGSGGAEISGMDSIEEAKDLALVLQTGALPLNFAQIERTDISATLGEDSLREAVIAGIGGLIAVAAFLLFAYRFLGLVAVFGLAIYGTFLYGAILLFNMTLTLPGFAGLILTIGVAADANIVIFERIKEEVRAGKSVRAAIGAGYRKGFATIVDANVATAITALVLFMVATGGVRGFALMLLIGTGLSLITAVLATRALLGLLGGMRWFDNPAFMGASAQKIPAWQQIDFVGRRMVWFVLSGAIILVGAVSLAVQGLNLGIDFRGGTQVTFKTPQAISVEAVRTEVGRLGYAGATVQGRGEQAIDGYRGFRVLTESLSIGEQSELRRGLERELDAQSPGIKSVSESFSGEILKGALLAIVVSLALLVIYITVRFEFKFSVPVLVALVHDILVTIGVYSVSGREVTTATVAAVLTILGYSIYDTIIIFDRVRENIPLMRNSSFAAIANQSLWETLRRSLATSLITLLPIASLLVFGGDTLKDFAFALLIGIASGAYSTIFIATPILSMLKERETDYAKLRAAGLRDKLGALGGSSLDTPARAPLATATETVGSAMVVAKDAAERQEQRRRRRRTRPHGRSR